MIELCILYVGLLYFATCLPLPTLAKTSLWRLTSEQYVISYEAVTSARSNFQCVRECSGYSHCVSAAYELATGLCYIHPNTSSSDEPGNSMVSDVYTDQAPTCTEDGAPLIPNADVTSWRRYLTSLEGDVSCHADYSQSADGNLKLRCLSTGDWTTVPEGIPCRQKIWRQNTVTVWVGVHYSFPHPMAVGQTMCLTATPTANTWFAINLIQNTEANLPLHMSVRFTWKGTYVTLLSRKINNSYGTSTNLRAPDHPFPFVAGQQFDLNITASGPNQLDIYHDGTLYYTWTTSVTVDNIDKLTFLNDLQVHYMNLQCND